LIFSHPDLKILRALQRPKAQANNLSVLIGVKVGISDSNIMEMIKFTYEDYMTE
jgi:hypothetical protein